MATYAWLVVEGSLGNTTWIVDFFDTTNPVYRAWRLVLPDYMNVTTTTWVLHGAWITVFVALSSRAVRNPGLPRKERMRSGDQPVTTISVRIPSS